MTLLGNAVIAIWHDIVPEGRAEFIEWHNREHMPDRVGNPGFLRGRRYSAQYGSPQYYTLYEAENKGVLVGRDYLERLNNPTPWTQKSITFFRNVSRGLCSVAFSHAHGDGGFMLTLRFDVENRQKGPLKDHLCETLLPVLVQTAGVTGVHLCITDRDASRMGAIDIPNWIVMIEASLPAAADKACDRLLADDETAPCTAASQRGLYTLEVTRLKKQIDELGWLGRCLRHWRWHRR